MTGLVRLKVGFLVMMLVAAFSWVLVSFFRFSLVWFSGLVLRVEFFLVWFLGLVSLSLSWPPGLNTVSKNFFIELICVDGWFWFMVLGFGFLVFGVSVFFGGFSVTILGLIVTGVSFSSWFWSSSGFWFLLSGFGSGSLLSLISLVFFFLHMSGKVVGFLVVLSQSGTPFLWLSFLVWVGLLGVVLWLVFVSGLKFTVVGWCRLVLVLGRAPRAGIGVGFWFGLGLSCGEVVGFSLFGFILVSPMFQGGGWWGGLVFGVGLTEFNWAPPARTWLSCSWLVGFPLFELN